MRGDIVDSDESGEQGRANPSPGVEIDRDGGIRP